MPLAPETTTGPLDNPEPPPGPAANPVMRPIPGMPTAAPATPKPKRTRLVLPFLFIPSAAPALPLARVSYTAAWYDEIGRATATANYGTCDGHPFTRPATIPERCDEILVTSTRYNHRGEAYCTTDPAGREQRQRFDDAGRLTETIDNYEFRTAGLPSFPPDVNRTVRRSYNVDGALSTLTAINPATGDQITRYAYGTTLQDSGIARADLLRAEIYPDSDNTADPLGNGPSGIYDRIEYCYNRQGETIQKKDQNETVHQYTYDPLGRPLGDLVTALGENIDGAVQAIGRSYNARGLVQTLTSYSSPTLNGGIVNQVRTIYNASNQPVAEYQEHSGAVNMSTTPSVGYAYAANGRLTALIYPNGRKLHYQYNSGGDDALDRVSTIADEPATNPGNGRSPTAAPAPLVKYRYLGQNPIAQVDYPEPGVRCDYDSGVGGSLNGVDRFGRVRDLRWWKPGTGEDLERVRHGYDANGNRLYRECPLAAAVGRPADELYTYDGLDQLRAVERGRLTSGRCGLVPHSMTFAQAWELDATGNWGLVGQMPNAGGAGPLAEMRRHNAANEIVHITPVAGPEFEAPAYDRGGNVVSLPAPNNSPAERLSLAYDAWNRLVSVARGTSLLLWQSHSAGNDCIIRKRHAANASTEERHQYHTRSRQELEHRSNGGTTACAQYIWGLRYLDELVLREVASPAVEAAQARLYALQDANWNVVATTLRSGDICQRFAYEPYGAPLRLTPRFEQSPSTLWEMDRLFAGYAWDEALGAYVARARFLWPWLGVWNRRDPIVYDGGDANLYRYVASNPVAWTDPTGTKIRSHGCLDKYLRKYLATWASRTDEDGAARFGRYMYTAGHAKDSQSLEGVILVAMLKSPYVYYVAGLNDAASQKNLGDNVATRINIVDITGLVQFRFGEDLTLNVLGQWPSVDDDPAAFFCGINNRDTRMGCAYAAKLVFYAGIGKWEEQHATRQLAGGPFNGDWVPGDWGGIANQAARQNSKWPSRYYGENVICVGDNLFWGHTDSGTNVRTMQEWFARIRKWEWDGQLGAPAAPGFVRFPTVGLDETALGH